jgi:hypothetical protein
VPQYAPIPDFARGPDIPSSGYLLTDLGEGLHGITSGILNTMFLVTKTGVVLLDAPPDLGDKLLAGIGEVTTKPVTHIVYSHAHADHIGSADLIPGGLAPGRQPLRPRPGTPYPRSRQYVADLRTAAKKALGTVDQAAAVRHVPTDNRQARRKTYVDAVVDEAAHLVPDSWTERVDGFDIFLKDDLNVIVWSVMIDQYSQPGSVMRAVRGGNQVRFHRVGPQAPARAFVTGLLSGIERKTC